MFSINNVQEYIHSLQGILFWHKMNLKWQCFPVKIGQNLPKYSKGHKPNKIFHLALVCNISISARSLCQILVFHLFFQFWLFNLLSSYYQKLAKYLQFLDENPSEYAKYHSWRTDYGVNIDFRGPSHPMCKLCALLHEEARFQKISWHVEPHSQDKECDFKKWDFSHVEPINLSDCDWERKQGRIHSPQSRTGRQER